MPLIDAFLWIIGKHFIPESWWGSPSSSCHDRSRFRPWFNHCAVEFWRPVGGFAWHGINFLYFSYAFFSLYIGAAQKHIFAIPKFLLYLSIILPCYSLFADEGTQGPWPWCHERNCGNWLWCHTNKVPHYAIVGACHFLFTVFLCLCLCMEN